MHINKIYIMNMLFNVYTDEKMLRPTQVFINRLLWVVFLFWLRSRPPCIILTPHRSHKLKVHVLH